MEKCAFCKQTVTQSLKESAFPMSKVKQHAVQSPVIVGWGTVLLPLRRGCEDTGKTKALVLTPCSGRGSGCSKGLAQWAKEEHGYRGGVSI